MKRTFLAAMFAALSIAGLVGVRPAEAAPPGPQCGAVVPCEGPVEKIVRVCQQAICKI